MEFDRNLSVIADDQPVESFRHAWLTGVDSIGLLPMSFILRMWNLSASDYYLLASAKRISVSCDGSVLVAGSVSDICKASVDGGVLFEVLISTTIELWEAPVALSLESGITVSETVKQILLSSSTGITLLSYIGEDPVRHRGQSFYGRAGECIDTVLSAAKARCCLTPSGLCIIPQEGLPVSMTLTDEDLIDEPVMVGGTFYKIRTKPIGWLLGKTVSVQWKSDVTVGLVVRRSIDADNDTGNWEAELLMEIVK